MSPITTREQDQYGYWYTRIENEETGFIYIYIYMERQSVEDMHAYFKNNRYTNPEAYNLFAKYFNYLNDFKDQLGGVDE
jgi:hypothetical protein